MKKIGNILKDKTEFETVTAYLKAKSPYYPEIFTLVKDSEIYYSTKVRILRDELWYSVHCVKSYHLKLGLEENHAEYGLKSLMSLAWRIHHLYVLNAKYQDVDELQISEVDRLTIYDQYHLGLIK